MIKVKNTINKELTLNYKGEDYVLGKGEIKEFEDEVAKQWKYIYGFLNTGKTSRVFNDLNLEEADKADEIIEEKGSVNTETVKAEVAESEDIKEEVKEEVKEDSKKK